MHEGLASKSEFTRLLAIALLNWADDEGYFMANPILIRGQVFPFLDDSKMIPRSLHDLSTVGWIELSEDDQGRSVGRVVNFAKHQRVDKPKSSSIKPLWKFQDASKIHPRCIQDASKEEGNGMEQGTGNGMELSTDDKEEEQVFEFWNSFPQLPKIMRISKERKAKMRTRLKDFFFRENWKAGIEAIPTRPFLIGQNDRGWKADIEWFMQPDSLTKIMEGKYTQAAKSQPTHREEKKAREFQETIKIREL
jgi:hypothetical protein